MEEAAETAGADLADGEPPDGWDHEAGLPNNDTGSLARGGSGLGRGEIGATGSEGAARVRSGGRLQTGAIRMDPRAMIATERMVTTLRPTMRGANGVAGNDALS